MVRKLIRSWWNAWSSYTLFLLVFKATAYFVGHSLGVRVSMWLFIRFWPSLNVCNFQLSLRRHLRDNRTFKSYCFLQVRYRIKPWNNINRWRNGFIIFIHGLLFSQSQIALSIGLSAIVEFTRFETHFCG